MTANIRTLAPLPKPLLTSPAPVEAYDDPVLLGKLADLTRVAHTIGIQVRNLNPDHAATAVAICRAINDGGAKIPATIVAHYSPFHDPNTWPRSLGADHWGEEFFAEIGIFESDLRALLGIAHAEGVAISHVVLDPEVFGVQRWGTREGDHDNGLITAKNDIMFGIVRTVLPDVPVIVYNQHVTGRHITGIETVVGGTSPAFDYPQDPGRTIKRVQAFRSNASKPRPLNLFVRLGYGFEFTIGDDGKLIRGQENWNLGYDGKIDFEYGQFYFGPSAPPDERVIIWPHPLNPKNVTGEQRIVDLVKGAHSG